MLNASYNLPSEDCNTEKQMVFHSNKLLCVYSLQSWLSDTFTFGCEPPCCWQARGDAVALGRASRAGGDPARPPQGSAGSSDRNVGNAPAAARPRALGPAWEPSQRERPVLGSHSSKVMAAALGRCPQPGCVGPVDATGAVDLAARQ